MEQKIAAVARQRRDKHISAETNKQETMENMLSMFSSGVACLPES
jgi:hypothetical protein